MRTTARMRAHAKAMRHSATRAEGRLWRWLRDRRFSGYKFRRQHPLGSYILDFYCPELKLAIEVDGRQHKTPDMIDYDDKRSATLRRDGIHTLRIPNEDLIRDGRCVEEMIVVTVDRLKSRR